VREGAFGFDFTKHAERIRQPMVRKGGKLYPCRGKKRGRPRRRKLNGLRTPSRQDAIGFIGSNRTSNEEKLFVAAVGARDVWTTTSITTALYYTGLNHGAGRRAGRFPAHHGAVCISQKAVLCWKRPDESEPPGRMADSQRHRHFGTKLFIINANEIKLKRKHAICESGGGPGGRRAAMAGA